MWKADFTSQFKSPTFSDCRVICGDRQWNVHRFLLCARSKYFEKAFGALFQAHLRAPLPRLDNGEGKTCEVDLSSQDPEDLELVLRYIYSSGLSYIEATVPGSLSGTASMDRSEGKMKAYNVYVPIYALADYLCVDGLCGEIVARLRRENQKLARWLQRTAVKDPEGNVTLGESFAVDFAKCARMAYDVPLNDTNDIRNGIRSVFRQLLEYARYRPLNDTLDELASEAPGLLADAMRQAQVQEGFGHPCRWRKTCRQCSKDPLEPGNGFSVGITDFWIRNYICYTCSLRSTETLNFRANKPVEKNEQPQYPTQPGLSPPATANLPVSGMSFGPWQ
ncbi:hypothetical protein OQA88_757 [Cercophora sp. LCS_1]